MSNPKIPEEAMSRELRLKLAFARLLPDMIEVTDLVNFRWKTGPYAGELLRETEWNYVVEMADAKLGGIEPDEWFVLGEIVMSLHGIEWE